MCGRYTLKEIPPISQRFGLRLFEDGGPLSPRFNISPSQQVAVIVETDEGRELQWMSWGYQPAWAKAKSGPPPINARAETLLERPMFRNAVGARRCIIPADSFYEWQAVPGQRRKQAVRIGLKDGSIFGFAGLYTARPGDAPGEVKRSCVIITTEPNDLIAPIHHRMPVILARQDEARWLDRGITDPLEVLDCLRAYPAELMQVQRDFGDPFQSP